MATLQERLAAAKKAAEEAEAKVSAPEFVAAEEARKELASLADRKRAADERARAAAIAARLDAAHERLGDDAKLESVALTELPDFFIVGPAGGKAYAAWLQGTRDAAAGAMRKGTRDKINTDDVNRAYVVAGVVDWNGKNPEESEVGSALHAFFRNNAAVVAELYNVISRLDGAASEARKR